MALHGLIKLKESIKRRKIMCSWCEKKTEGKPQVSAVKVPMVCEHCGGRVGRLDYKGLMKWKKGELICVEE